MFFPPQGCRNLRERHRWTLFGVPHLQSVRSPFLARKSLSGQGSVECDLSSGDQAVGLIESPTMLICRLFLLSWVSAHSFWMRRNSISFPVSPTLSPTPTRVPTDVPVLTQVPRQLSGTHGHDFYPGLHHSSLCPFSIFPVKAISLAVAYNLGKALRKQRASCSVSRNHNEKFMSTKMPKIKRISGTSVDENMETGTLICCWYSMSEHS